jgi:electron transfer flavoprotein alpha subunit
LDILVVLENNKGAIHRMSLEAIVAAQKLAAEQNLSNALLALGADTGALASAAAIYDTGEVLTVEHNLLSVYNSDGYAAALRQVIDQEKPSYVFFGHTYMVRDYVPKISAQLQRPFLCDVISLNTTAGLTFAKQAFNAKLAVDLGVASEGTVLVSFQSASFNADLISSGSAQIREVAVELDETVIKTTSEEPFQEEAGGVDLTAAEIIISVGRGIGKEENLPIAEALAQAIGGEISSSRPVVDSGWLPSFRQIGSSGQTVSPKLYFALGISGAIQHVVGMKGSKNIVAINKDAEAPIFELADYGVVGDLLEIVPKLTEAILAAKN